MRNLELSKLKEKQWQMVKHEVEADVGRITVIRSTAVTAVFF
jgi:hypothetical protein